MEKYKLGNSYEVEMIKATLATRDDLYVDLSRPMQVAIRNSIDVIAVFYVKNEKATCIFTIHDVA